MLAEFNIKATITSENISEPLMTPLPPFGLSV